MMSLRIVARISNRNAWIAVVRPAVTMTMPSSSSSSSKSAPRMHVLPHRHSFQRRYYFQSLFSNKDSKATADLIAAEKSKKQPMNPNGDKLLYEMPQEFHIRMMFGVGCINVIYWSYYLISCHLYKDVVHQGINFGGDPMWGYVGAAGTVAIFYATREYSNHAAYYVYETADGKRIGMQMHTMLGFPGRKIEASIGNVRLANTLLATGGSSYVPLRVEGVDKNVLIDRDGTYYANGRLHELLKLGGPGGNRGGSASESSSRVSAPVDSKEKRVEWFKQQNQKRKQQR